MVGGLYLVYLFLSAFAEVKTSPREEMFMCQVHGPIRKQDCITFIDLPYCPICFNDRMNTGNTVEPGRLL